ncbi:MAG: transglutaminase domain-containing protein [Gemmatimonadota bacterium]
MDLEPYRGLGQLGPAYRAMLERDAHAPGSVDRVLAARMVRLCAATAPVLYGDLARSVSGYRRGSRPRLEAALAPALAGTATAEERVQAIVDLTRGQAAAGDAVPIEELVLGGTEEEILGRPTDWCTDLARLACALCQVAGIPARLVLLFDTEKAYSGHVIIEARRQGVWGAADAVTGLCYVAESRPVTTWELMKDPALAIAHRERHPGASYSEPGQFRTGAVVEYGVGDAAQYDYTTSRPNAYYRALLAMSARGWPGGLRWLHGEDGSAPRG